MSGTESERPRKPSGGDDAPIPGAFRRSLPALAVVAVLVGAVALVKFGLEQRPPETVAPPGLPVRVSAPPREPPKVQFTDVSEAAGVRFAHVNGAYGDRLLPETMGSGAAFFDFDSDGDQDLLLVNSQHWEGHRPPGDPPATMSLYRNDGNGRFDEVTAGARLDLSLYGMGVAVGDYDSDGDSDLFVTALGPNRLLRNDDGRFTDVTQPAGVAGEATAWSTSAAFFDYDRDGLLDLFVANYVRWTREVDFEVDFRLTGIGRAYGPPGAFEGSYCYLYRNRGDGTFEDVSRAAGIRVDNPATGRPMAKALAVVPVDVDGDGWIDIAVANDTVQNFLFRNRGDGAFEETGTAAGMAFDRNGAATGAMGMDTARFRNDGELALAVGNFANEMTSLYVTQDGGIPLADEAIVEGIGADSRQALTFGLFFFDYDLDGRLDLLQANGHLEQEINRVQPSQHYEQPPQLFWNCGAECRATFVAVAGEATGDLGGPLVGRGSSYADIDGDGDLDLVITQNGRSARLFRNDQTLGHHWLRVRLRAGGGNRDAIGAEVELRAGGIIQRRQVMPTRGYLSQVELSLTFGLGDADAVESIRVTWPDGSVQVVDGPPVDRIVVIEQTTGILQ